MVLDGDAGEISASQRQLLQEAFTISERMVHLISDFLNVSRLQTGKFVIDQVQTDLVSLVAEEVANVSQVASAHKVNVRFRKPARFPLLYLDENKLRQVIMSLIDNAIYYSPNADTVRVRLSIEDGDVVLRSTMAWACQKTRKSGFSRNFSALKMLAASAQTVQVSVCILQKK